MFFPLLSSNRAALEAVPLWKLCQQNAQSEGCVTSCVGLQHQRRPSRASASACERHPKYAARGSLFPFSLCFIAHMRRSRVHAWIGSCKSDQLGWPRLLPAITHIGLARHMFEQLLDSFRRASQSTIQGQQQLFKQWLQQWPGASSSAGELPSEWPQSLQKQWLASLGETLNRQRELLDSSYRKGAQLIEQASQVSEVKSPEDYRRLAEELWRSFSESLKDQAEANVRDFQKATQRWLEVASQGGASQRPATKA